MKKYRFVASSALCKIVLMLCAASIPLVAEATPFLCRTPSINVSITNQTRTSITFLFSQTKETGGAQPWVTLYTSNRYMLRSANGSIVQCQARGFSSCSATYTPGAAMVGQVWAGSSLRPNGDLPTSHTWCSGPVDININPAPAGCQISNGTNRTIPIGEFGQREFRGIGTTMPAQAFALGLSCTAGTNVSMTVSSSSVVDASRGLMGVTGGASGVAIQLLDWANNPVSLGTLTDYGTHGPGWDLTYSARYYQVSSTVTPGVANGMVTFTLQYR